MGQGDLCPFAVNMSILVYDIQQLNKTYPGQSRSANADINLQIAAGEIFGLLGDNGAGKSTLVRQMANLLQPPSGHIRLMGQEVGRDSLYVPMQVGYMPQDGAALNMLTVGEALYFTGHLRGLSRSEAREERDRLIELWQIEPLRHKPASRLSGGERRLVVLATAMVGSPPVLILDEPTNDLAPQRRQQVWHNLRQLNREQGTTIIFITHDAIEAEKIIQRVGIMWQGRLVALGWPSELKQQIAQQLRLELFMAEGSRPQLPPHLPLHELDRGRWLVYLHREEVSVTLNALDLNKVDDFRLYSVTLEDLYLHYAEMNRST